MTTKQKIEMKKNDMKRWMARHREEIAAVATGACLGIIFVGSGYLVGVVNGFKAGKNVGIKTAYRMFAALEPEAFERSMTIASKTGEIVGKM